MTFQITRRAVAQWVGSDQTGSGKLSLGSGAFEGPYSLRARVENVPQANPEELIGAALAACFTMSVSNKLTDSGYEVSHLETSANVRMAEDNGSYAITDIRLEISANVSQISFDEFVALANEAKSTCPVSKALAGTVISLDVQDLNGS